MMQVITPASAGSLAHKGLQTMWQRGKVFENPKFGDKKIFF